MANELWIGNDDVFRVRFMGVVSAEDVQTFVDFLTPTMVTATADNPIKLLVYTGLEEYYTPQARKDFIKLRDDLKFGRVTLVGTSRIARVMATLVLRASGRGNVRFFDEETDALDWLLRA